MAAGSLKLITFTPLTALPNITHAFTLRDNAADTRAAAFQEQFAPGAAWADQPHGAGVAHATGPGEHTGADALITRIAGLPLVVRVADCAAVYLVDRRTPAIGLIHSGKKGTQLNIAGATVVAMEREFGTDPGDCLAVISPSIGPCHYEVDLWAGIEAQLRAAGVREIHNPRCCTACHLDRFYSYRAEKGHTGRHLAKICIGPSNP